MDATAIVDEYGVSYILLLMKSWPDFSMTVSIKERLMENLHLEDEEELLLWLKLQ